MIKQRIEHQACQRVAIVALLGLCVAGSLLCGHDRADAKVPQTIHYQGKLTEPDGSPLVGEHIVTLRLYDAATGGTKLWEEQHTLTLSRSDGGIFSVVLGSVTAFSKGITFNDPLWLTTEVDGEGEFSPRQPLSAVGYAINADRLNGMTSSELLAMTGTGTITGVIAGTGLAGGGTNGAVTLSVDVGTTAGKIAQLDSTGALPAVSGAHLTDLNASNLSSGTIPDARLSSNVSLLGSSIESSEITDGTIIAADTAPTFLTAGGGVTITKSDTSWQITATGSGGTITGVTAGAGLIGGGTSGTVTLDIGAGNGIQVNADDVAIKLSSGSGLLADGTGLSLLRTCANAQILKWNTSTNAWECAADADTNSGGSVTSITAGTGLTGGTITTSGTIALAVPVSVTRGGTAADLSTTGGSGQYLKQTSTGGAVSVGAIAASDLPSHTHAAADITSGTFVNTRLAGPLVNSITAGTGITNSNPGGVGAATVNVDVGTTANKIIQLDSSAKLPIVDGSALTNLNGSNISSGTVSSARLDTGTTANKIVQLDASAKLHAVDGSALTNLNAGNVSSGTLALARGGTGATTASAARANLSAAASGPNSDITSLSGLTMSLSVAQGGTGAATLTQGGLLIGQGTSAVTTTGVLAKGTLIVGDGVTDPTFLAAGGNHAILMADTTQASGLKWATGCMPIGGTDATNRSATFEMSTFGVSDTSNRGDHLWPVPASGTVTTLRAFVNQAPSGTASWTVRLRKNGANATLNCVISGTGTSCSASGTDTFAAGDRLGVEFTEGGSASGTQGSGWSACFVSS